MGVGAIARRVLGAALGGLVIAAGSTPAPAASLLEKNFYLIGPRFDSVLPACDNGYALWKIRHNFETKESRFWNSALQITGFDHIREVAFRPWADGTIPRRYCSGRVLVSDGRWRTVRYSIIEDGGMIGANWGVEFCVVGLDRNWAYNPACRAAGP